MPCARARADSYHSVVCVRVPVPSARAPFPSARVRGRNEICAGGRTACWCACSSSRQYRKRRPRSHWRIRASRQAPARVRVQCVCNCRLREHERAFACASANPRACEFPTVQQVETRSQKLACWLSLLPATRRRSSAQSALQRHNADAEGSVDFSEGQGDFCRSPTMEQAPAQRNAVASPASMHYSAFARQHLTLLLFR
eukprot:6175361-Pleurochrysis_carterae.AAC.1